MNHLSSETFGENAKAALADSHLRGALKNATSLFGERRKAAAASLPNWEDLRSEARAIKDEALSHLDLYLEEFAGNAESRGAHLFREFWRQPSPWMLLGLRGPSSISSIWLKSQS